MFKSKNLIKRITAVASAAVIYTASMSGTFLGSPMEKYGLQNTIVAEAASVLDGAEFIASKNSLQANHWYMSKNGQYGLIFQGSDGNLVIYRYNDDGNRKPYWASGTDRCDANLCQIQDDGNFVIYDKYRRPVWTTDSFQTPASLYLSNNGELFIYSRKTRSKVWSSKYSSNPNGTRIYQEPKNEPQKPSHTHRMGFESKNNRVYYGCYDCDYIDHEVDYYEYVQTTFEQQKRFNSKEEALARYFYLLDQTIDEKKALEAAKAFYNVVPLGETKKTGLKKFIADEAKIADYFPIDSLPDCEGKTYVAKCQIANKCLGVYDLLTNNNSKTVNIGTLNTLIDVLHTATDLVDGGSNSYGKILDQIQTSAKESVKAGLKKNIKEYLLGQIYDTWDGGASNEFWANTVTLDSLKNGETFEFDGYGNLTVKKYLTKKFGKDGSIVYEALLNLKCVQEATGIDFWELVEKF
ncbi:hypothetical protein [Ruminococcus albus]|uniref:D-mannose binding lectin n=1 Tax=Ruminococcus albus TaxID=1264 RepID=A0A1I1GSF2_RUMAL|nr:hypothetical protein [Ruminococcus albus]SFC14749.1 D-mannose binding lectin [Ruminococcus albus]